MEMRVGKRKKEKTLAGMFLSYMCLFCVNTLLLLFVVFMLFDFWMVKGIALPANYAQNYIKENSSVIRTTETVTQELIPDGCPYGVYDSEGNWQYGTFTEEEKKGAWSHYLEDRSYAQPREYYSFIPRENGEVFIVRCYVVSRFANLNWEKQVISPESILLIVYVLLFFVQAVWLSKMFAKQLKERLETLRQVTGQIAENNLDFDAAHSDVKEIEQVLVSLNRMRDALKNSLKQQWDMEQRKKEQLAALAHDIKTPLAVIRGNAELLEECGLAEEEKECNRYILQSTEELENYFITMRQLLSSKEKEQQKENLQLEKLQELLAEQAGLLRRMCKVELVVLKQELEGNIIVDKVSILRAWNNLLDNALEYTRKEQGIRISFEVKKRETQKYFVAKVEDYGRGFSQEELRYGAEEFFRGDESRSDREHQGLGLAIAKEFAEAEGGFLLLDNSKETKGAVTALWLPISEYFF